jgi:hypothetical protein
LLRLPSAEYRHIDHTSAAAATCRAVPHVTHHRIGREFVDLRDKRELNRGFGDTLSRAFEFAATSAIFGLIGYWIDGRTGTRPLFMLLLSVACLIGQFLKLWYLYDAEMKVHEAALPSRGRQVDGTGARGAAR